MTDTPPERERPPRPHWLADVAAFSGTKIDLRADASTEEIERAWSRIARAAGIGLGELARRIANHFRLEVADLDAAQSQATRLLPEEVARRFGVFPLKSTDAELVVATSDPRNREAERQIAGVSGRRPSFRIAPPQAILERIEAAYRPDRFVSHVVDNLMAEFNPDGLRIVKDPSPERVTELELEAPAVVKLTSLILDQAATGGAHTIRIEPERDGGRVRLRVDDEVRHFMHLPVPALTRVVYRIKKLAGMEISVRDRVQRGTIAVEVEGRRRTLWVVTRPSLEGERLSVHTEPPDEDESAEDLGPELAERPALGAALGRVLVVDDDPGARLLMRAVLEKMNFEVLEAEDGPPALRMLEDDGDISLLMLDLKMPRMDGLEVLERVRNSLGTAGLPVIVLTGVQDPGTEIRLLEAGADDYLRKPMDPERLSMRVRAVLRRAGSYEPWPDALR